MIVPSPSFLVLHVPPTDWAGAEAAEVQGRLLAAAWTLEGTIGRRTLWSRAGFDPPVTTLSRGRGWIIGEHHPMPGEAAGRLEPGAAGGEALARELSRTRWGRYVAVLPEGEDTVVYRDPSGHLAAHIWTLVGGVRVVASDATRLPAGLSPPRLGLRWDRIAVFLATAGGSTTHLLLDGSTAIGPGDAARLSGQDTITTQAIWRPARFGHDALGDAEDAAEELVRRVDDCTAALATGHGRLVVELSGGLDSAIVAASLGAAGEAGRVACWLNFAGDRVEGDERRYAADVVGRLDAPLTSVDLPLDPLTVEDFAELGARLWPAVSGADAGRDRCVVRVLADCGATGLMSGQGGDAVFFQMPTALVFADAWRRDGLSALRSPLLGNVSRRTRTSAWAVVSDALRGRARTPTGQDEAGALVTCEVREAARVVEHAWVGDADAKALPPGKALQVLAIANCHVYHGESRRGEAAAPLYPLLAQPVIELALRIGVPELAGASFDRPYARRAFRDRLPPSVIGRRAKGRLSVYFAHLVAASADNLRPYLLDGCLADAGLLDRRAVARILDPDQLIRAGRPAEVLRIAATEAWVRYWQTQAPDAVSTPGRSG